MSNKLKQNIGPTKKEKKVMAKALVKHGYTPGQIEKFLGISDTSVLRAAKEATPDDLKRFEEVFNREIQDIKRTNIALVQKRLLELIPKERRIDQVVKAGEFLEGKSNPGALIQQNFYEEASKKADSFMVEAEVVKEEAK